MGAFRPSKEPNFRRESAEQTKRPADVSVVPDHNAHAQQQQQQHQQQQWHPPPPDVNILFV